MLLVNENDKEYRFGDSGPKYLMRGPNVDFGIVRLKPGEGFPKPSSSGNRGRFLHP